MFIIHKIGHVYSHLLICSTIVYALSQHLAAKIVITIYQKQLLLSLDFII